MANNYYRNVILPVNLCKEGVFDDYAKEIIDPAKNQMWRIEGDQLERALSDQGKAWLASIAVRVDLVEIFHLAPHHGVKWHIDYSGNTPVYDYVKINYVKANNTQHYMQWGTPITSDDPKLGYNIVGSPHLQFEDDQIQSVEKTTITGSAIVNVGVPHRGQNDSDEPMWFICFIPKRGMTRISFEAANEVFREWIVPYL